MKLWTQLDRVKVIDYAQREEEDEKLVGLLLSSSSLILTLDYLDKRL